MEPQIIKCDGKKLIGRKMTMSFADYRVGALWAQLMPRRREIQNPVSSELISMSIYSSDHFRNFHPSNLFEKWAAVEVSAFDHIPEGFESYVLPGGLYAVFNYKGLNTDHSIFEYIYGTWIPSSAYELDDRPHFEILGPKYKNNDPESEEEIWIPIRSK